MQGKIAHQQAGRCSRHTTVYEYSAKVDNVDNVDDTEHAKETGNLQRSVPEGVARRLALYTTHDVILSGAVEPVLPAVRQDGALYEHEPRSIGSAYSASCRRRVYSFS
ncbi:hypothetical protein CMQ_5666 [Grosmannia clavigera kw1407]|uniref:Uncharacterized protein n=1 Tax=Grosmannia clavigera (strain kw1407 / UAMH 11150) TaxID=655863 RepID=F0XT91_GROCL|nr:uncharacterized protein CMQ_5666 [Grosmannia clavigera kw1407]EFW99245.1 hypothetical protein CMQ_5666 [Grosmannia clavigera kw1407]